MRKIRLKNIYLHRTIEINLHGNKLIDIPKYYKKVFSLYSILVDKKNENCIAHFDFFSFPVL